MTGRAFFGLLVVVVVLMMFVCLTAYWGSMCLSGIEGKVFFQIIDGSLAGAMEKDRDGNLPLHLALRNMTPANIVAMLEAFPDGEHAYLDGVAEGRDF